MELFKISLTIILLTNLQIKVQSETFTCGRRLINHEALIVNGYASKEGDWPWHTAILHIGINQNIEYKCGGTLLNSHSVLTAAHCVYENDRPIVPDRVLVQLARNNLKVSGTHSQDIEVNPNDSISTQIYTICQILGNYSRPQVYRIFAHHDFNESSLANDIAVVRLATAATFNNYIQPICLWDSTNDLSKVVGRYGTVVGFGVTETDQISYTLRQAAMPVVDLATCLQSDRNFYGSFLSDSTFCAGFRNGTSACNGDSGGGLVFAENGVYRIRGIVSLTQARSDSHARLCKTDQYVVFTDVAKYVQWIREMVPGLPSASESITQNQNVSPSDVKFCYFLNNDLTNARIPMDDCRDRCASTPRCTHFTWTNYNGGTCWMKRNRVTTKNAHRSADKSAVCGIVDNFSYIAWNRSNLAFGCDFWGNDLENVKTGDHHECSKRCALTEDCTHFAWNDYEGGTCWMKENSIGRGDAFVSEDRSVVCGVVREINWNGNKWAVGCDFRGNDLIDVRSRSDECGGHCAANRQCTHFTWNAAFGGTCWMKQYNGVTKDDAIVTLDRSSVCGVK